MPRHPVEWTTRRKLFLAWVLAYLALLALTLVMLVTGSGLAHALTWAIFGLLVTTVHLILQQTVFKQIVYENRNAEAVAQPRKR